MPLELLPQVRLLDPVAQTDRTVDVLIEDGIIRAIAPTLTDVPSAAQLLPSAGCILGPGLIDLYSHSGEPGFEARETLVSLTQAAAAGGFTRLHLLPDTQPAIDNPAAVAWMHAKASHGAQLNAAINRAPAPRLHCWAALTLGTQGQQMTALAELAATEMVGFADGQPIANLALVRRLLEYLQPLGKPVALWACEPALVGHGVMREGLSALRFGLPGNPVFAETAALAALLECVAELGTPVHLMRISTARSVALIAAAKARGVPITASTTWLHLLHNATAVGSYDPNLRLEPPLGNPTDQVALVQAVRTGVIDAIAIDHTPYTYEEKTVPFAVAPPGAIGLELALPLLWQALVVAQQWSGLELWQSLSSRPAGCLGQTLTPIAPGQPAELTLFDPHSTWTVNQQTLKSLALNTSWCHQTITGRVVKTWCLEC
jgi:dihydroorotase